MSQKKGRVTMRVDNVTLKVEMMKREVGEAWRERDKERERERERERDER